MALQERRMRSTRLKNWECLSILAQESSHSAMQHAARCSGCLKELKASQAALPRTARLRARQAALSGLEVSPPLFDPTNTISTSPQVYAGLREQSFNLYKCKHVNKPLFLIFQLPPVLTNCSSIISMSPNCSLLTNL